MSDDVRQFTHNRPKVYYGYIVVLFALFIMIVIYGMQLAFGVFFKPVMTEFGWTRAMTSGAFSLSLFAHGILGVVMGALNDRLGPRVVLTIGGVLIGTGYILMSQVNDLWQLYIFYGLIIGIGMSSAWVPLLSTAARWFTARRSMMSGVILTGTGIGTLIAAPVATWLISIYDWRIAFTILGIVLLVVIIISAQFLKRDPSLIGQLPYGESKAAHEQSESNDKGYSLPEAVRTRQFWLFFTVFFCFGYLFFSIMVHLVPHITDMGISAATAASILATIGGLAIAGRIGLGVIADKIGNRRALMIGFILITATLFFVGQAKQVWMLYLFAGVFGFAHGGMGSTESPLAAGLFGLRSHGLLLGILDMSFTFGAAVGPVVSGYLYDVTSSYLLAFLLCAALGIVGIVFLAFLTPTGVISSQKGASL